MMRPKDLRATVEADLDRCAELARRVHELDGYPPNLSGGDIRSFLAATERLALPV